MTVGLLPRSVLFPGFRRRATGSSTTSCGREWVVAKVRTNRQEGERPRWGRVFIVAGRWKGCRGTYDDDDRGYCIVYPDGVATPVLVRPSSIIEAPEPGEPLH